MRGSLVRREGNVEGREGKLLSKEKTRRGIESLLELLDKRIWKN